MLGFVLDDILKRRLLLDGDSGQDDKRLNLLVKSFLKWLQASPSTPSQTSTATANGSDDCAAQQARLNAILWQSEFASSRANQVYEMNVSEQKNYAERASRIEAEIVSTQQQISRRKADLVDARRARKNRLECDALAQLVGAHAPRSESQRRIETLRAELRTLIRRRTRLDERIASRKKQCRVLITALHAIESSIEAEKEDAAGDRDRDSPSDDEHTARSSAKREEDTTGTAESANPQMDTN